MRVNLTPDRFGRRNCERRTYDAQYGDNIEPNRVCTFKYCIPHFHRRHWWVDGACRCEQEEIMRDSHMLSVIVVYRILVADTPPLMPRDCQRVRAVVRLWFTHYILRLIL